jgi:hypothetical protein
MVKNKIKIYLNRSFALFTFILLRRVQQRGTNCKAFQAIIIGEFDNNSMA